MIFDCTMYFQERELLELRLATLGPYVDGFVICESDTTHRGYVKNYELPAVLPLLPYAEKVRPVYCRMRDLVAGAWDREAYQRDSAERVLRWEAHPDDWMLVGDLDEIPNPAVFDGLRPGALEQRMAHGWMNRFCPTPWRGTVIVRRRDMGLPSAVRQTRVTAPAIPDGGWHFSYLGGVAAVQEKLRNFAHAEFSGPPYTDAAYIQARMLDGAQNLFAPEDEAPMFFPAALEELPAYVREHPERFAHLMTPV